MDLDQDGLEAESPLLRRSSLDRHRPSATLNPNAVHHHDDQHQAQTSNESSVWSLETDVDASAKAAIDPVDGSFDALVEIVPASASNEEKEYVSDDLSPSLSSEFSGEEEQKSTLQRNPHALDSPVFVAPFVDLKRVRNVEGQGHPLQSTRSPAVARNGEARLSQEEGSVLDLDDEDEERLVGPSPSSEERTAALHHRERVRATRASYQLRALMRKNTTLQIRQKGTLICQVLLPVFLLIFTGIVHLIAVAVAPPHRKPYIESDAFVRTLNQGHYALTDTSNNYLRICVANQSGIEGDPPAIDSSIIGKLSSNGIREGMLGSLPQYQYMHVNTTVSPLTYSPNADVEFSSWVDIQDYVYTYISDVYADIARDTEDSVKEFALKTPAGGVAYKELDISQGRLSYDLMYNNNPFYPANRDFKQLLNTLVAFIHRAFTSSVLGESNTLSAGYKQLPYWVYPPEISAAQVAGGALFPFALSFLLPVFMHMVVLEKQRGLRTAMRLQGVTTPFYWAVSYVFTLFVYVLVVGVFLAIELALQNRFFTQTNWALMLIMIILWGFAQVSFSFFLAAFFHKTSTASLFGYMLVVINVFAGDILNAGIYPLPAKAPLWTFIYPPFAFYRIMYMVFDECYNLACPTWSSVTEADSEIARAFIAMAIQAVVLQLLAMYLDLVLPQPFQVRRSPLLGLDKGISWIWKKIRSSCSSSSHRSGYERIDNDDDDDEITSLINGSEEELDGGSAVEIQDTPVMLHLKNLNMVFDSRIPCHADSTGCGRSICNCGSRYHAVRNLNLKLHAGEFFGLLGKNGAGKTTTIRMLTGLQSPTSGDAEVCGLSILTQLRKVHRLVGMCPQFDVQWPDLTPREHVLFSARLRGIPPKEEKEHCETLLRQVGLLQFADDRTSGELSGGMRRRLSVAQALAGNPSVLILDEPTTGLDPLSQKQLWKLLAKFQTPDRLIILTSHSMEEVDYLCTRLCILDHGRLVALGTTDELRARYAPGQRLQVLWKDENDQQVHMMLESLQAFSSHVELLRSFNNLSVFSLSDEGLHMDQIYAHMQQLVKSNVLIDWEISGGDMEDVFMSVVEAERE